MEENILSEGNVVVTTSRLVIGGKTHAMSGVTSVSAHLNQSIKGPGVCAIIGLAGLYGAVTEDPNLAIGSLMFLAIAFVWWFFSKKCILLLSTAAGHVEALTSRDGAFIGRIVDAVNEAIVQRG